MEKKYLIVELDAELDCIIHHWKGFATSEQFREGLQLGYQLFFEKKVKNIIIDAQESGAVKNDDTNFAASLFPMLLENGLKKFAFVVTEKNLFSKLSAETYNKKANAAGPIRYFSTLDGAKNWIKS